jgi:hypothetical protein
LGKGASRDMAGEAARTKTERVLYLPIFPSV